MNPCAYRNTSDEKGIQLSSQIKGAKRKALYDSSVAEDERSDFDELLKMYLVKLSIFILKLDCKKRLILSYEYLL